MLSKGSTWSRWDLHIHTPCSIYNEYGGDNEDIWEKYITYLENLPEDVEVIGINDYYFIDGFEKVMHYKMNKGRLSNFKKIFPIIEFRIDKFATASESKLQKVNLHVLFKIDDKNWKNEIQKIKTEFIQQINVSPIHDTKPLSKESFIEIAGSLRNGFDNYVPSADQIFKLIESDTWKDRVMVFLGYKEWNNLEKGGQLKPYKEYLLNKADALFTASPSDNVSKKESILTEFGGSVLIHSMDIHKFSELDSNNYQCYTWIKADPTFEGLKQIIYEPKERVKIQKGNPFFDEQKSVVIDKIKINSPNNWFSNEEIPLNSGLITIIGEKGSGKTALLDLLAISNDEGIYEPDKNNHYSFYNRAREEIKGTKIHISYLGNDEETIYTLDGNFAKAETNPYAKVRYLSLKELESYVDQKEKFQSFIKDIIHTKTPELNNFDELIKKWVDRIQQINNEISNLEEKIKSLESLEEAYENKNVELELHKKNEPKIKTNFTEKQEEEYKSLITKEQEINAQIGKNIQTINKLNEIKLWINEEIKTIKEEFLGRFFSKISSISGFDTSLINSIKLEMNVIGLDIFEQLINKMHQENKDYNEQLKGVLEKIKPLDEMNKNFKSEQKNTRAWIEKKSKLEEQLDQLKEKINSMEKYKEHIQNLQQQRKNYYINLLNVKLEQKSKYMNLKSELESDENISFKVKIEFNTEKFLEKEDAIINHASGNSQYVIVEKLQQSILEKANKIDDVSNEELETVLDFIDFMDSDSFINVIFGEKKNKENLLKKSFKLEDLYNWLYGDYYDVNYYIEYKGKPLETLSPGQKGLVLMKVFLKLDNSSKPLLIDQPEDNLDNKSVFKDLVNDFREIKKKRQIIIATHNPNLVVNTDSEQVIIAKFEDSDDQSGRPKIVYISGSLENNKIRNQVCEILEGGDTAFSKREKRYSLK